MNPLGSTLAQNTSVHNQFQLLNYPECAKHRVHTTLAHSDARQNADRFSKHQNLGVRARSQTHKHSRTEPAFYAACAAVFLRSVLMRCTTTTTLHIYVLATTTPVCYQPSPTQHAPPHAQNTHIAATDTTRGRRPHRMKRILRTRRATLHFSAILADNGNARGM